MRDALNKHFSAEDVALVQAIIDNLSYSKEAKQRKTGLRPIWEELGKGELCCQCCGAILHVDILWCHRGTKGTQHVQNKSS